MIIRNEKTCTGSQGLSFGNRLQGRSSAYWLALPLVLACSLPVRSDATFQLNPAVSVSLSGKDDVAQLKRLASGVGREFASNNETDARLKKWGMRTIRCINVDPVAAGSFDADGKYTITKAGRLDDNLETCRAVGATPHIIIGLGLLDELCLQEKDVKGEDMLGIVHSTSFGPTDWVKFRSYYDAVFEYVLVTKGFRNARFEVGNEADTGGGFVPAPPVPPQGSAAAYDAYFNVYKSIAQAADKFEKDHPGLKITLGGPASTGVFTLHFGDFDWGTRFIRDCGLQKIRLDFVGFHYYGNLSSLHGEYPALYPSFETVLRIHQVAIDAYKPGTPIWITEWGPSYWTNNEPTGAVNGNHVAASFAAEFLETMLENRVDGALYLVTTDLIQSKHEGEAPNNNWGWCSLFVSPDAYGGTFPKAPAHVFDMISRLAGTRIQAGRKGSPDVKCFASADKTKKTMTLMVWNYNYEIPEFKAGIEHGKAQAVSLKLTGAAQFFGGKAVKVQRQLVAQNISDAYALFRKEHKLDSRVELQKVACTVRQDKAGLQIDFSAPPSSVSFVVLSAA